MYGEDCVPPIGLDVSQNLCVCSRNFIGTCYLLLPLLSLSSSHYMVLSDSLPFYAILTRISLHFHQTLERPRRLIERSWKYSWDILPNGARNMNFLKRAHRRSQTLRVRILANEVGLERRCIILWCPIQIQIGQNCTLLKRDIESGSGKCF